MIGTIPFLGYLFRLEEGTDGAAFVDTLQSAGDLRWNICTQADEMVVHQEGDVVFFLMCPYTLEAAPRTRPSDPKPQSGGKLGWGLCALFAPGQGRNPTDSPAFVWVFPQSFLPGTLENWGKIRYHKPK